MTARLVTSGLQAWVLFVLHVIMTHAQNVSTFTNELLQNIRKDPFSVLMTFLPLFPVLDLRYHCSPSESTYIIAKNTQTILTFTSELIQNIRKDLFSVLMNSFLCLTTVPENVPLLWVRMEHINVILTNRDVFCFFTPTI
jgi:Txe/YoeB family toxin of Txe-Axe toxin-antitoxin module